MNEIAFRGEKETVRTPSPSADPTFCAFADRIKQTYGVIVYTTVPATEKAMDQVERGLAFYGRDFMKSMNQIWLERNDFPVSISLEAKRQGLLGTATGSHLALYEGFPDSTVVHELFHIVETTLFRYEKRDCARQGSRL